MVEDDEEQDMREQLEMRAWERQKWRLRVALEWDTGMEGSVQHKQTCGKDAGRRK